jgi:hypothetical protein
MGVDKNDCSVSWASNDDDDDDEDEMDVDIDN